MTTQELSFENIEDAYPLLQLQLGMLFHSEYASDTAIYHDIFSYHLRAPFDAEALHITLRQLAARHAVLRTSFDLTTFSTPLQLVHRHVDIPLRIEDVRHLSRDEQIQTLLTWKQQEEQRGFDWTQPPLLRFQVHRSSSEEFLLTLSMHHSILDGWSVASLITELTQQYFLLLGLEAPPLPPAPVTTFRDFVALEQEALASPEQRAYWLRQLQECPTTRLGRWSDSCPRISRAYNWEVPVPGDVWEGIRRLAQEAGVPLKTVLLAAYLRMVSLLSGQQDILTGCVSHGRPETRDGDRVLGLFLNTLPFRFRLRGGTWRDLLAQTFEAEGELLPFRRFPLAEIQNALGAPLQFETVFNFTHFHVYQDLQSLKDFEMQKGASYEETNFPLGFQFSVVNTTIRFALSYNEADFCKHQMQAIAASCVHVLAALVRDPDASYQYQSLLGEEEAHQLLVEWNATQVPELWSYCLHERFEQQAEYTPDTIALVAPEQSLSYGALNRLGNQMAHFLQQQGVEAETPVGLLLERVPLLLLSLLGILKAGGTVVPLDPGAPQERLLAQLQQAEVRLVLTTQPLEKRLPGEPVRALCLDAHWSHLLQQSTLVPQVATHPQQVAYLISTSGSTGTPKGVLGLHQGATNSILASMQAMGIQAGDRLTQCASFSFDLSLLEVFQAWLAGATLCQIPSEVLASSSELVALLRREALTMLGLPPSLLQMLPETELPDLRMVLVGGERCPEDVMRRWGAGRDFFIGYGPTETAIQATLEQGIASQEQGAPLGRPLANVQTYVLDGQGQPVPIGVVGELYIGGEGLARGYVGRGDLTAERFVPHPFSRDPGQRLYRTGDLVRWQRDGHLEFVGREDGQVKLRGHRIELGEIEHTFLAHRAVKACVVVVNEDIVEGGGLVAYLVGKEGENLPSEQQLRSYAQEKLPNYMLPTRIMTLERLPLTPNGKIDRRNLPDPVMQAAEPRGRREENRLLEPMEELIMQVWQQVLHKEQIGVQQDFFEIGGHSLLATQVVARLRRLLDVTLPLRALFESPTISGLAARVQQELRREQNETLPALVAVSRDQELPLSFAQQRLWFLDQLHPGDAAYNIPVIVSFEGRLVLEAFASGLTRLIERHESLRTIFQEREGQPYQVMLPPTNAHLTLIDVRGLSEEQRRREAGRLGEQTARLPFDLRRGPLLRSWIIRLAEQEHRVCLNMHHIVSDGWSMGVLVQELTTLYQAASTGQTAVLDPLPIQYADYAYWQRQWLQGETLKEQIRYWTRQLSDAHALELPTDYPRPVQQSHRGASYRFQLGVGLSQELSQLSRQEGVTLFMTLLAGFQILLARLSGDLDIVVGTDSANRSHLETEGLIGFFINLLVLRTTLHENPTFLSVLQGVREMVLGAYAHQELPFEMIVEHLHLPRESQRTPLVNVLFVMQNMPLAEVQFPDMAIRPVERANNYAKFDLALFLSENERGLSGSVMYSTDLFKEATIARMMQNYEVLLHDIVAHPESPVESLEIQSAAEKEEEERNKQYSVLARKSKLKKIDRS